ncbi:hypothetical protein MUK42_08615 [Musa troglodytarum]|uniref:WRKY domain-containing protein n=1 Tax=Musa troglodytarum TaxID=320322 RepID=A0A9E7EBV7_9LILI|nr:hypothetical protein MUK42_08615 [Musa troglodytarum]
MENSLIFDSVIQEIEHAFDLTKKLQSHVELGSCSDRLKELVRVLEDDLLQIVRSRKNDVKPQKKPTASLDVPVRIDRRKIYVRREITATPFDHDHQWRKYGEKKITGCIFSRKASIKWQTSLVAASSANDDNIDKEQDDVHFWTNRDKSLLSSHAHVTGATTGALTARIKDAQRKCKSNNRPHLCFSSLTQDDTRAELPPLELMTMTRSILQLLMSQR